ncbi:LysR family transcriptional regulator [Alcaligenaceae bacterium]|nr:LysR family transcriptional regulator [Alcaligenaceae bacterium]
MRPNLKLFNAFLIVAETGSVRNAADKASRSDSAISMQIKQLEAQLGTQLFHRTGRKLELTVAGRQLLVHVRQAMQQVDRGLRQLKQGLDLERGNVVMGCSPTIAATRLPQVLSAFSERYPGIELLIRELTLAEQLECLRQGTVDFCLGPAFLHATTDILFEYVVHDQIYALLPADMAPKGRTTLTLAEYTMFPALMLSNDSGLRPMMDEALRCAGLSLKLRCEARQISTLIAMVRNGMGAALLPRIALDDLADERSTALRVTHPDMERSLGILSMRNEIPAPAAQALQHMIREMLPRTKASESIVRGQE